VRGFFALMRRTNPRMVKNVTAEKSLPVNHGRVNIPVVIPAVQEKINTAQEPYSLTSGIFIGS
jgi:hypothetical protein